MALMTAMTTMREHVAGHEPDADGDRDEADDEVYPAPCGVVHVDDQAVRALQVVAVVEDRRKASMAWKMPRMISMMPAKGTQTPACIYQQRGASRNSEAYSRAGC